MRQRQRPTNPEHRHVHSVRQGLSGRRFAGDGLARRCAWRRQAHCRQPAHGPRFGKDLFERLRIGRGPGTLSAEPAASRSRRRFPRDRQLHAIRWSCRRAGRHNQYDDGRQPAGQWYCGRRLGGKRPQIRLRQTERSVDNTASRAGRESLVREDVAASPPRQQLALLFRVAAQLSGIRAPSFLQLLGIVKIRRADPAASRTWATGQHFENSGRSATGVAGHQLVCNPNRYASQVSIQVRRAPDCDPIATTGRPENRKASGIVMAASKSVILAAVICVACVANGSTDARAQVRIELTPTTEIPRSCKMCCGHCS